VDKSTLSRSETVERLSKIAELSDAEIAINAKYIRLAAKSARVHIVHLRSEVSKAMRNVNGFPVSRKTPGIKQVIDYLESIAQTTGHFVAAESEFGAADLAVEHARKEIAALNKAIETLSALERW